MELAAYHKVPQDVLITQLLTSNDNQGVALTISAGNRGNFRWLCGHGFMATDNQGLGPRRQYGGMVIGKALTNRDLLTYQHLTSLAGNIFRKILQHDPNGKAVTDLYLTSLLKTLPLEIGKWRKAWIKEQLALLYIEILLVRPRCVMTLGKEVSEALLGRDFRMTSGESRWSTVTWDLRQDKETQELTDENQFSFEVLPCVSPGMLELEQKQDTVERLTRSVRIFMSGLETLAGQAIVKEPTIPEYRVIRSLDDLDWMLDQMANQNSHKLIGVDAEWQGRHPQNQGSFLRCAQFCWAPGQAAVLHLADQTGKPGLTGPDGQATGQVRLEAFSRIRNCFVENQLRVAGFYFQADHEWLAYYGLDLMDFFRAADTVQQVGRQGGFAVDLAVLAYDELMDNELETVRWRFTDVPDYYSAFSQYRQKIDKRKLTDQQAAMVDEGFGWIPDDVLYPYAGGDADVTLRAAIRFIDLLSRGQNGIDLWVPYWNSHRGLEALAEMMRNGLPVSLARCYELSAIYDKKVKEILDRISVEFNWPDFPIDTWQQLSAALYGREYSGYRDQRGTRVSRVPDGAITLELQPILTNEKTPTEWSQVLARGEHNVKQPSTSLSTIAILLESGEVEKRAVGPDGNTEIIKVPPPEGLRLISDAKSLRQVQKNFLGKPQVLLDQSGQEIHSLSGGYPELVCQDGYLRCFLSSTKETGRWSAAMPNLHNSPNRAEAAYKRIMGKDYPGFVRTIVQAPPGYVIVEADYASAELFMLAIASGDSTMWDHCTRNLLPEDHPDFVDPHARLCVNSFKFNCIPNKAGLSSIGKGYMRNVAKCFPAGSYVWTDVGPIKAEVLMEGQDSKQSFDLSVKSLAGFTDLLAGQRTGLKPCLEIRTSTGHLSRVSEQHRHLVTCQDGSLEFRSACTIVPGQKLWLQLESGSLDGLCGVSESVEQAFGQCLPERFGRSPDGSYSDWSVYLMGLVAAGLELKGEIDIPMRNLSDTGYSNLMECFATKLVLPVASCRLSYRNCELFRKIVDCMSTDWTLVPECSLLWDRKSKVLYLLGILTVLLRGHRQGRGILIDSENAISLQHLFQTAGYVVRREPVRDNLDRLTPFCKGSNQLFSSLDDLFEPGWSVDSLQPDYRSGHLSALSEKLRSIAENNNIPISKLDYCEDRETLLKTATILSSKRLSQLDKIAIEDITRFLNGTVFQVTVTDVVQIGELETFDFETTDEQQHILVVDGFVTHNSVIYGWAYGRQAPAIVLEARESGVELSVQEAQALLDALVDSYPSGNEYLMEAARRVEKGFLVTPMGRIRRFPDTTDRAVRSGYEREAKNAPIQGGVADVVNIAASNLVQARRRANMTFYNILQMHDAFYFLVPYNEVEPLCNEIIPDAMCGQVPIIPYGLDGSIDRDAAPKFMGNNVSIYFSWKQKLSKDELVARCRQVGIDVLSLRRIEL